MTSMLTFSRGAGCDAYDFLRLRVKALPDGAAESAIQNEKGSLLRGFTSYEFCDIIVKPFEVTVDGLKFGLIYSEVRNCVNLEPGALIAFTAPWDGEYYT